MHSFTALADPTRRRIIERLAARSPLCAQDIGASFSHSAPAISQHLKILRDAGLVRVIKSGRQRFYSLNPAGIDKASCWLARQHQLWESRFDRMEAHLQTLTSKSGPMTDRKKKPRKENS
ncbi:MAG: metalloregulator ArsR/SmtB family transcription factor [Pseudomonadota bacterium]